MLLSFDVRMFNSDLSLWSDSYKALCGAEQKFFL
jgi:hypothetical protein